MLNPEFLELYKERKAQHAGVALSIEIRETANVKARFDKAKNTLELVRDDEAIRAFNNEIIDSGALAGKLPMGQVVLPLDDSYLPEIHLRLEEAGVVELLANRWSTYGGARFVAARVLI